MSEVQFTSNLDIVLQATDDQIRKAMEDCGLDAEKFAKLKFNEYNWSDWSTGNLRNSITHEVEVSGDQATMTVGSGVEYAPYVELGTGVYYSGGRQTPWVFTGPDGKTHLTHGMKPRPYLKPAIADHKEHYKEVIKENLKG